MPNKSIKTKSDAGKKSNAPSAKPKKLPVRVKLIPIKSLAWLPKPWEPQPSLLPFKWSDSGNAERLLTFFGHAIVYSPETKMWLIWNGKCWTFDTGKRVRALSVLTMRSLAVQAGSLPDGEGKDLAKFAHNSENAKEITNMLAQAAVMGAQIEVAQLDLNPMLLNCENGTVDLRTGKMRPHNPGDHISKMCRVPFYANAECKEFLSFLTRIMGESEDFVSYLKRILGYAITGLVSEKTIFCLFGSGDNGKTTLLEILRWILGTYSAQVQIDSLMAGAHQTQNLTSADLSDLRGARFVTTSEVEEGQRLAEAKVKYLTGMGEVKSCRKYENPTTFRPQHKIFMDGNHRPVVRGTDPAIWRRLRPIHFTVSIPEKEKDKRLLDKLKAEAPGILAWAIQGCLEWQRVGLSEPRGIELASAEWKAANDPLKVFLEERCVIGTAHTVNISDLYEEYSGWAKASGERPLAKKLMSERLEQLGFKKDRSSSTRFWVGLTLQRLEPHQIGNQETGMDDPLVGFRPDVDANAVAEEYWKRKLEV